MATEPMNKQITVTLTPLSEQEQSAVYAGHLTLGLEREIITQIRDQLRSALQAEQKPVEPKQTNETMKDNKIELLNEEIECVHRYLDDMKAPRYFGVKFGEVGANRLSIVGRIKFMLDAGSQDKVSTPISWKDIALKLIRDGVKPLEPVAPPAPDQSEGERPPVNIFATWANDWLVNELETGVTLLSNSESLQKLLCDAYTKGRSDLKAEYEAKMREVKG